MRYIIILLLFSAIMYSCRNGNKDKPDGGACSYEDHYYPALLLDLEMNPDSITWNAWFEIDNPSGKGKDTVSYLRMTNQGITRKQLQKDSIIRGAIYQYVVSTLKAGNCDPDMRTIRLKKY